MNVYSPMDDSFLLIECIKKENLVGKDCLDVGCGSGVISEAMLLSNPSPKSVMAIDLNPKAIIATKKRINLVQKKLNKKDLPFFVTKKSDLFSKISPNTTFDLISFNPPYLPSEEIKWIDLDGGKNGREVIDRFVVESKNYLKKEGFVLLLISSLNNLVETKKFLKKNFSSIRIVGRKKIFFEELVVFKCKKPIN